MVWCKEYIHFSIFGYFIWTQGWSPSLTAHLEQAHLPESSLPEGNLVSTAVWDHPAEPARAQPGSGSGDWNVPLIQRIASASAPPETSEKVKTRTGKRRAKYKELDYGQKEDKTDHGAGNLSISARQNSQGFVVVVVVFFLFVFFLMRKLHPSYNSLSCESSLSPSGFVRRTYTNCNRRGREKSFSAVVLSPVVRTFLYFLSWAYFPWQKNGKEGEENSRQKNKNIMFISEGSWGEI